MCRKSDFSSPRAIIESNTEAESGEHNREVPSKWNIHLACFEDLVVISFSSRCASSDSEVW